MMTKAAKASDAVAALLTKVEARRQQAGGSLNADMQRKLGQFFTPSGVAEIIAAQPRLDGCGPLKILDAGAGIGVLTAALVGRILEEQPGRSIQITAVEIDRALRAQLEGTLSDCQRVARELGTELEYEVIFQNFIHWGIDRTGSSLYSDASSPRFDIVIQNPPYGKVGRASDTRRHLAQVGVEVPNMYAAFLAVGACLLGDAGQLVAITPRSFCNGAYFKDFRRFLLSRMSLDKIAVFHERGTLFSDSSVLQETIIFSGTSGRLPDKTTITTSRAHLDGFHERVLPYEDLVHPTDAEMFIRIPTDADDDKISQVITTLDATLTDLGIQVSTGKVVDFRATEFILDPPADDVVPLLYPRHLREGRVAWPVAKPRKPDGIKNIPQTRKLLLPPGTYVAVKRLSAKEEVRRVVASVYRPCDVTTGPVAFENHLNVFHSDNRGLKEDLAVGLAIWLNSSVLDLYFRQFSGHTQVNATDLRTMRYPAADLLASLGRAVDVARWPEQAELDELIEKHILGTIDATSDRVEGTEDVNALVGEARHLLSTLNFDSERSNERSALVLLALANLNPSQHWRDASNPQLRTVEIMDFLRNHHGRDYKPNTRETIRRQTLHQFVEAGLVALNPDQPDRPINSPKTCYQVTDRALEVLKEFGTTNFDAALHRYLSDLPGLQSKYAAEREVNRIPVLLPGGIKIDISPGGQNMLIKQMIKDFCAIFAPHGNILYIGDADSKWKHFDQQGLSSLGIHVDKHGKMPDLIVHMPDRNWLILLEAASSHGPVDAKRHSELNTLFAGSTAGLVFVSCFPDRVTMRKHLANISWETEVWCADAPTHMIHFNGERFLGPYDSK